MSFQSLNAFYDMFFGISVLYDFSALSTGNLTSAKKNALFFFFFEMEFRSCHPGWSAMV